MEKVRIPGLDESDGFAKKARMFASRLGAPLAIADKIRSNHGERATVVDVIGEVAGRNVVLVGDVLRTR